jgi:hypothetical protein
MHREPIGGSLGGAVIDLSGWACHLRRGEDIEEARRRGDAGSGESSWTSEATRESILTILWRSRGLADWARETSLCQILGDLVHLHFLSFMLEVQHLHILLKPATLFAHVLDMLTLLLELGE